MNKNDCYLSNSIKSLFKVKKYLFFSLIKKVKYLCNLMKKIMLHKNFFIFILTLMEFLIKRSIFNNKNKNIYV